ncbi:MAG: hypothetical protein R3C45_02215 [Phycisphaerales bacterium]
MKQLSWPKPLLTLWLNLLHWLLPQPRPPIVVWTVLAKHADDDSAHIEGTLDAVGVRRSLTDHSLVNTSTFTVERPAAERNWPASALAASASARRPDRYLAYQVLMADVGIAVPTRPNRVAVVQRAADQRQQVCGN